MKQHTETKQVQKKRRIVKIVIIAVVLLLSFAAIVFLAYRKQRTSLNESEPVQNKQGEALAIQHCQSCHMLPHPGLLDKENWKKLLPEMGVSLGIHSAAVKVPEEDRNLYPTSPAMSGAEWQSILDYYDAAAPASLPLQTKPTAPQQGLPFFAPLLPPEVFFRANTKVTCVRMDNSVKPGRLFVYDAVTSQLYLFSQYGFVDSLYIKDNIVDIQFFNNQIFACSIGKELIIGTSTNTYGKVFPIEVSGSGKLKARPPLFDKLARPVQLVPTDLNSDGKPDFLVCSFGGLQGSLSWMENKGGGKYQQQVLHNMPGSVNVYVRQNKQTKHKDLWALFAQGKEGIFHFKNKGNGTFDISQVLEFPPSYGSTSFEMADINNDGSEDIIYSCGDNGDITGILKPYHGVYVFTNNGMDVFEQKYFYPMHGCYKVLARDFRNSGNIDLAAIAFFTDHEKPEPFVFLKNEGQLRFTPYGPPAEVNFASVLTMDAGDFNGDGKEDLIIGNAQTSANNLVKGSPFAILANSAN